MLGSSPTCLQYVFALVLYDVLTFKEMKIRGKIRNLCAMTFMELFRKKSVNALYLVGIWIIIAIIVIIIIIYTTCVLAF